MKLTKLLLTLFVVAFSICTALQAEGVRRLTTTLLPLPPQEQLEGDGFYWIQNQNKIQNKAGREVNLRFDLSKLPGGIGKDDFKCTLRLGAKTIVYVPKQDRRQTGSDTITVTVESDKKQILTLYFPDSATKAVHESTPELADVVRAHYDSDKTVSFRLFTITSNASSLFYSTTTPNAPPSSLPRLVVEYTLKPPSLLEAMSWPQRQQNPEHTGRTPWKPFVSPIGFSVETVPLPAIDGETKTGSIVDYPLVYQGNLYVVDEVSNKNYLLILDFKGNKLKQKLLRPATIERPPVISANGILYTATRKQIDSYDLNRDADWLASWDIPGELSRYTDLTMGNDGSLFLPVRVDGNDFIYGLTADLKPFLATGSLANGASSTSNVTVSADGKMIFAQTPKGPVVIDIANPSPRLPRGKEEPDQYYYLPVAGPVERKSTQSGVVFSDFRKNAVEGNVSGYWADLTRIWNASGTLAPQPVLGSNGLVYFLQGGKFTWHAYDKKSEAEIAKGDGLNATSNLVMDGANNVYFWDSGTLRGYKPTGDVLLTKTDPFPDLARENSTKNKNEPEQFIRLMVGPDGTLWANNKGASSLYAFKPIYADENLTLKPADLEPGDDTEAPRVYRTTGILTVNADTSLKAGTNTLFQAQKGIAFGPNFTVEKRATFACRTGF
jgi:hypothetical protein